MIAYLIKVVLCSAVFLTIYYVLLEKSKTYAFNRFYLLGSVAFAILIPFITVALPGESTLTNSLPTVLSNSNIAEAITNSPQKQAIDWLAIMTISCYISVLVTLLYRFVNGLIRVYRIVKNNEVTIRDNTKLIVLTQPVTPHTFLKHIFLNKEDLENRQILTHELAHARQLHSLDIILIEFIHCIFWFNPALILFKRSIRLNHEFLADESVLEKHNNVPVYQQLLLSKITGTNDTVLASSFNYSITKKRFTMMTSIKNRKQAVIRIVCSLALLMITSVVFINKAQAQAPAVDEYTIYKNGIWQNQKLTNAAGLQSNEAFLKSIQREIRYPQAAKQAGVVGDVTVMFEVNTKGKVNNFTLIQKLDDMCDEEVIRAIKNSTAVWNVAEQDGRKYSARYVLRVSFKLEDLQRIGEYDLSTVTAKALNPVIVVGYR